MELMATIPDAPVVSAKSAQKQVVISARITEEQLQALNIRLKVDGYENIGQLLRLCSLIYDHPFFLRSPLIVIQSPLSLLMFSHLRDIALSWLNAANLSIA